ncbi:dienelactone hydrolase family protein [Aspergillus terreus]|uniref:Dienelactone hydrolase family protein n=1 Tax=Aspergillus terreus TaxID=33178 RepID=A0A5M3Z7K8_ASPTE|nr:hypothetical protein ATETN484_0008049000 [Aspergillus terreus]GFF21318.1 dienelactone hydrolase family protein [Aspergillus terreus]
MKCIVETDVIGDDRLVRGELITILQVMRGRLHTKYRRSHIVAPVMLFSIMGPFHVRVLEAYYNGDKVVVRKTKLYDLREYNPTTLDLLHRWWLAIPPVVAKGYEPKGEYKTINGLKTYVTGPESATKAILVVYDIFGFFPQTLQGADILSTSNEKKYRVFMPDFFEGQPADITWFPPQTDDHKQKLGNFFQTKAAPPNTLSKIPAIVSEANKLAPNGQFDWSILGYCWGGKIACLASGQENTIFKAAVQCHPAMLAPDDAKSVSVPMAVLASKDENPKDVTAFGANLKVDHYVETFSSQIHGWMAARSNLEDAEVRKEYERGYRTALDFFHKHA